MAAYAALVSLMQTIEQIENHPRPPISLDKTQVESLTGKVTILQEFLEGYSHVGYSDKADDLEMRIADAAHEAEDVIDSHIVKRIHAETTSHGEAISSIGLYEGLEKVMQDMDLIRKEVEVEGRTGVQDLVQGNAMSDARSSSTEENIMVGFDDVLIQIMDKLTDGQLDRQIIPIVGMGGSGKTTLAKHVYKNQLVVEHFDLRVWVTVSQYETRDILLELLEEEREGESLKNECKLGEKLHKRLSGRRYLIVMDDIWDVKAWDQLKMSFPNNNNGSRIMLTTRLTTLASEVADSNSIKMIFLDEDYSWKLFCKPFGEEGCPFELRNIGKKIVKNCKGLPLSIIVIGALLAKSKHDHGYWECIRENLSSIVNSEDNESCLKILYMSYTHLPVYLKPCFLYMGVFREDSEIHVSTLIRLWVGEGFLKPIRDKSLEIVAKEYLKDLIDRNLILVHQWGPTGSIKVCKIHDLLRDLCLREAQKERFYSFTTPHCLPQCINDARRSVVFYSISKEKVDPLKSKVLARSLIWDIEQVLPPVDLRLLRILKAFDKYREGEYFKGDMLKFVNSRYIAVRSHFTSNFTFSIYRLWNLQILIVCNLELLIAPYEFWHMPQLRHVEFEGGLCLPDPPNTCIGRQDDIILKNLQKLVRVINYNCGDETVKRMPNIKNLKVRYEDDFELGQLDHRLNNFERLHKLESFLCDFSTGGPDDSLQNLTFPHSLKKLTLIANPKQYWEEDTMQKIGSLPFLEILRLRGGSFYGHWETVDGQFCRLKFLEINKCRQLKYLTTEDTHFPCLERLLLKNLLILEKISSGVGEIPTMQTIELMRCSTSSVISAREILIEQQELGNEDLRVKVTLSLPRNEALKSLDDTPNFEVILV